MRNKTVIVIFKVVTYGTWLHTRSGHYERQLTVVVCLLWREGKDGGIDWNVDVDSGCGSYCFGGSEGIENCGSAGDKANDDESDCDDMLIMMTMTMIETVLVMLLKKVMVVMLMAIIVIILL